jgi:hypothetical protein
MEHIYIEIRNDYEGMFGGVLSEEMEIIDIAKTLAEYENELYNALKLEYPEIEFVLYYGHYGGPSIMIDNCNDWNEEEAIRETVDEIVTTVYERGDFWVTKEE